MNVSFLAASCIACAHTLGAPGGGPGGLDMGSRYAGCHGGRGCLAPSLPVSPAFAVASGLPCFGGATGGGRLPPVCPPDFCIILTAAFVRVLFPGQRSGLVGGSPGASGGHGLPDGKTFPGNRMAFVFHLDGSIHHGNRPWLLPGVMRWDQSAVPGVRFWQGPATNREDANPRQGIFRAENSQ